MRVVDANVLLYAVNQDSVHHTIIRAWWEDAVNGDEPIGLCWTVLLAFMRVSTNPRAFLRPLEPHQAVAIIDAWLAHPNIRAVSEADDHWSVLRRMIDDAGTAGNLTSDAHLASIAVSHGAVLVSCDSDFGRFRGLRWENPLDHCQT